MSNKQKVTAQEILETIQENGNITKAELAKIYDVCAATIGKRLNVLREDGEGLFHNSHGFYIMESIENKEEEEAFGKYLKWVWGAFKGLAKCGKVTKPLLLESKKYMREQLTKQERKMLTNYTAQVNRILTNIELEDDLDL